MEIQYEEQNHEICKTIRKLVRDDIREYNTMRVKKAVETGKGLKKAVNREQCKVIPSLKEEDGSITTNRERILERCAEFYQKLYEDTVQNITKMEAGDVPSILTCEVERALSFLLLSGLLLVLCCSSFHLWLSLLRR